jgi:hypothetical protein
MSEYDTIPMGFDAKFQVLWRDVQRISEQLAKLSKQGWIREQEITSLKFEVHALRLRILELEEEKRKGFVCGES